MTRLKSLRKTEGVTIRQELEDIHPAAAVDYCPDCGARTIVRARETKGYTIYAVYCKNGCGCLHSVSI